MSDFIGYSNEQIENKYWFDLGRKEREVEIIEIIDKWYEDDEEISYYQYEDLIKKIKEQKEQ